MACRILGSEPPNREVQSAVDGFLALVGGKQRRELGLFWAHRRCWRIGVLWLYGTGVGECLFRTLCRGCESEAAILRDVSTMDFVTLCSGENEGVGELNRICDQR
jgi:hypothetical protein